MRIAEALVSARAQGVDRFDAQRLLEHLLQRPRSWLLAHDDSTLTPTQADAWQGLLARRASGEPMAYLTSEAGFHGLLLQVTPDVLMPRPDTEVLVDWALALLEGPLAALAAMPAPAVADLGTGSGAVALAVKQGCPHASVHASDASPVALAVARGNGQRLGLAVDWLAGDWWQAYAEAGPAGPPGRLHLALSNPPYIAAGDPHLPALRHEPALALVPPDGDGLSALAAIVAGAPAHLHADGWLLLEHGHDQADAVAALLREAGFADVQHRHDLGGHRRCTGGRWPGAESAT